MFGGSAAVPAPIDRFVIAFQFGCEGTWMLLRQQQKPSASCSRGAHSLSHDLILALMCDCIVFLQLGALPRLHRMLASPMLHMKQHAALSISFLCSTNSMAQLAATEAGTLSVVQDLFRSSRTEVLVTGLRFIFNLACVLSADTPNKSFSEPAAGCYV